MNLKIYLDMPEDDITLPSRTHIWINGPEYLILKEEGTFSNRINGKELPTVGCAMKIRMY